MKPLVKPLAIRFGLHPSPLRLSMVVATYNVALYIDAFFDSLVAQTTGLAGLEVIVVNDGSTDGSGNLADAWAARYPDIIRVIHQGNQGVAMARNVGLAAATGEWICFSDPDDFFSLDYIAHIRAEIMRPEAENLVAVVANMKFYYEATDSYGDEHPLRFRFANGIQRHDSTDPGRFIVPHTSSVFMRRERILAHGLQFDPAVRPSYEDAHFIIRLLVREPGGTITFLPAPIYYYRRRAAATSLIDGIVANPDWYAPHLEGAYRPLLKDAEDLRGKVPNFVQANILLSLMSKIRHVTGPRFNPDVLDAEQRAAFIDEMAKVMAHISTDVLQAIQLPRLPDIHRNALLYVYKKCPPVRPARVVLVEGITDGSESVFVFRWQSPEGAGQSIQAMVNGTPPQEAVLTETAKTLLGKPYIVEQMLQLRMSKLQSVLFVCEGQTISIQYAGRDVGPAAHHDQLIAALQISV
ncbi:glycosyltransferase family 2 protein [Loktanella sp. DJP18]|uniref:glycosyltransferase family 2 protein n=1 Tax=Loktanella sp. DJP18 TaxID=3409788 RepID=UPI003BB56FEE